MRDEVFLRGDVPMTKSEVRAISISKLELSESSVLYDVGAGTGSVSVESGQVIKSGRIYAVEKNPEAVRLLKANREKFLIENMEIIEGTAPNALEGLAAPTHAFLGGTSGNVDEILNVILEKNPSARIVINVIAVESLCLAVESLKRRGIEPEIVSVQVAKARKAGAYHLMQGQNPVYILSFGGNQRRGNEN